MASNAPEPTPPRPGGSPSTLARLDDLGVAPAATPAAGAEEELLPIWDVPAPPPPPGAPAGGIPIAQPVTGPVGEDVPVALPVAPSLAEAPTIPPRPRGAEPFRPAQPIKPAEPEQPASTVVPAAPVEAPVPAPVIHCPVCQSPRVGTLTFCDECGYYYSAQDLAGASHPGVPAAPLPRLRDRYDVGTLLSERQGVTRYRGIDSSSGSPVVIVRQELPQMAVPEGSPETTPQLALPPIDGQEAGLGDEVLPGFDEIPVAPTTEVIHAAPAWPSVAWERNLLRIIEDSALPAILDSFADDTHEYLVLDVPTGRSLWDAWDDPEVPAEQRFGWLAEVADALRRLHQCNAMLEALRPDVVVIGADGHIHLTDLADLLPMPVPPGTPVRGTLYTAPELLAGTGQADARADLYTFGAMLYALYVGRELTETDFERPGTPKPFIQRFPDVHPALGRLVAKTFRREIDYRFPTDEASREDPTGFAELIRTLEILGRTYDMVRLEIAAWTTTGMIRTGNEDAFALLHACESRQDDLGEAALVLLADGMGGYEAGEVAAALAIQALRQNLVQQKPFASLSGATTFPTDPLSSAPRAEGHAPARLNVEEAKQLIKAALKDANKQVFTASRAPGSRRRGMGCTAEVVYVDGRNVVVGHVGDSRTYHLHEGRMIQLTRDQTLVNRLVELGTLTAEEAEHHPRRNELQQAIGGQPDVEAGLYHGTLRPGDWVLVCSDGLSNHISANELKQMLQSEAQSAEMAARRLVNLANIEGATDNATVVVIRAT